MNKLALSFSDKYKMKIGINLLVEFSVNKHLKISTNYLGRTFEVLGDLVQEAINKTLDKERIIKNLSKTGDTPFLINEVIFQNFEDGFMKVASLNLVRRELSRICAKLYNRKVQTREY